MVDDIAGLKRDGLRKDADQRRVSISLDACADADTGASGDELGRRCAGINADMSPNSTHMALYPVRAGKMVEFLIV